MIAFNAKKIIFITINIIILFVAKTPNIVTLLNNKISIDDLETLVFLMIHKQIVPLATKEIIPIAALIIPL